MLYETENIHSNGFDGDNEGNVGKDGRCRRNMLLDQTDWDKACWGATDFKDKWFCL